MNSTLYNPKVRYRTCAKVLESQNNAPPYSLIKDSHYFDHSIYKSPRNNFEVGSTTAALSSESLDVDNLLDGFRGEYKRVLFRYADTVLDPNRHTSEMRRPSLIVRHVDATGSKSAI